MIDFEDIISIDRHFADFMHKLNQLKSADPHTSLRELSIKYWYESLRQRTGLEIASQLQQKFEPDAVSRNERGTIDYTKNKWSGYRRGRHRPQKKLLNKVDILAPGSSRSLDHPLWSVLDLSNIEILEGHAFLRRLTPDVQSVVMHAQDDFLAPEKILPLFRKRLNKLLRKPNLDALACLVWFLRKTQADEAGEEELTLIANTLHDALILSSLDLHSLNIAFPLIRKIIDDILPLALPTHLKYAVEPEDYLISAFILAAISQKNLAKSERPITWHNRTRFMFELLDGKRGLDIRLAMLPKLLLDQSNGSISSVLVKKFEVGERLRRKAWRSLIAGQAMDAQPES